MNFKFTAPAFSATVVSAFLFSSAVTAAPAPDLVKSTFESQTSCEDFVRFDDEFLFVGQPGKSLKIVSFTDATAQRTLTADSRPLDVVRAGNALWVLTFNDLQEWNFESGELVARYATFNAERAMGNWEHPTAMAAFENKLVISHGIWGASIFDLSKKQLVGAVNLNAHQAPMLSMATGVTIAGTKAYFGMDDVTMVQPNKKPAFRGLVVYDLEQNQVAATLDKMDAGSDALVNDGEKLIVSFMGMPIWKYSLAKLTGAMSGSVMPEPLERVWLFGREGHPTGRPALDKTNYYTCFRDRVPGGGRYKSIPLAFDRKKIKLD